MVEAIKTPDRPTPFILKHGDSYHIIADRKPYLYITGGSMEAFLCLIATYYVFFLDWCPEVLTSLLFVQTELLGSTDSQTESSKPLSVFLKKLREFVDNNVISDE